MLVFRLSKAKYAKKLNASGAANRWNVAGQYVLYAGSSRALASLEQLVHLSGVVPIMDYKMMVIEISNAENSIKEIKVSDLTKDWRKLNEYHKHQKIGSQWYEEKEDLLLKVPSAVIPEESNFVINTSHPDFKNKVKVKSVESYFWDERFFDK